MKDLTKGNIYKTFILYAIPLILSAVMSQAFSIINTTMAGKYLGETGLAATGATSGFFNFYGSIFWGWGMGLSIQVAKLFGAEDYKKLKNTIYNNVFVVFILLIVSSICIVIFKKPIFSALQIDDKVWNEASDYFVPMMLGYFLTAFRVWCVLILNSLGITSYTFIVTLISTILGCIARVFALTVLDMGVTSLAYITLIDASVICVIYFLKLKKCFKEMGVDREKISFDVLAIKETTGYAVPVTFQQMSMNVVSVMISPLVNSIGSSATAAYNVASNIYNINAPIYTNSAKTVSTYTAQCVGARKFDSLKKGLRVGFLQGLVFLTPVLLMCIIFADKLCAMYFPEGYIGESLDYCVLFTKYYLPFIFLHMINNLFHAFYRGAMAMKSLIFATLVGSVTRIIPTMLLAPRMGMHGIFAGWIISWILEAVFTVILYFTGIWKKEKIDILMMGENEELD